MAKPKEELKEYKKDWLKQKLIKDPNYLKNVAKKRLEYTKEWNKKDYANNPDYYRNSNLKNTHGITLEEYNVMFYTQNGCCKICETHQSKLTTKKKTLVVDHCHTSNKIRGLLCHNCNFLLGHAGDDYVILLKAIEYLK